MPHHFQSPEEYKAALARVEELRTLSVPEEAEELALLLKLIEWYEKGIIFLKSGTIYENEIYIDFAGG